MFACRRHPMHNTVLRLIRQDDVFVVETDASEVAIGAVLLVRNPDGSEQPAAYLSRSLTPPERNYSATEREALAVVWATKQLRPYVERAEFTIRTDHAALRWLFDTMSENQRICRWRLSLAEFRYTVEHRAGKKHVAPDCLSRMTTRTPEPKDMELEPPVLIVEVPLEPSPVHHRNRPWLELAAPLPPVSAEMMFEAQATDEWCREMATCVDRGVLGYAWNPEGLLTKEADHGPQILVPKDLREPILHLAHLPPQGAHPGSRRMALNILREFFWPSIFRDCAKYVA